MFTGNFTTLHGKWAWHWHIKRILLRVHGLVSGVACRIEYFMCLCVYVLFVHTYIHVSWHTCWRTAKTWILYTQRKKVFSKFLIWYNVKRIEASRLLIWSFIQMYKKIIKLKKKKDDWRKTSLLEWHFYIFIEVLYSSDEWAIFIA